MKLMGANAFLATGHEMRGLERLGQLHMAPLENGSDRNCELALTRAAAAQAGPTSLDWRNPVNAATPGAMRDAVRLHDLLQPDDSSGFAMEMWL